MTVSATPLAETAGSATGSMSSPPRHVPRVEPDRLTWGNDHVVETEVLAEAS